MTLDGNPIDSVEELDTYKVETTELVTENVLIDGKVQEKIIDSTRKPYEMALVQLLFQEGTLAYKLYNDFTNEDLQLAYNELIRFANLDNKITLSKEQIKVNSDSILNR